jgi:hypothetical protein
MRRRGTRNLRVSLIIKTIKRGGEDALPWRQKPQGFLYY